MTSPRPGYYQDELRDLRGNALVGAVVDVFEVGTTTPATIYSDEDRTPMTASPLPAAASLNQPGIDTAGNFAFFAETVDGEDDEPLEYDVRATFAGNAFTFRARPQPPTARRGEFVSVNELPRSPLQPSFGGVFTPAAVMAAATGGAPVHVPAGICVGAVSLPGGTVLVGIPGKSVFQASPGVSTNVISNADSGPVTVRDVVVDGNKSAVTSGASGYGFLLTSDGSKVIGCLVHDTRLSGVRVLDADDVDIESGEFIDCGDPAQDATLVTNAVTVQGHRIRVRGNRIAGSSHQGIGQSALTAGLTSGLIVHDNTIRDSGVFGIALGNLALDCEVTDNFIDGSSDNSIDTGSTVGVKVTGNTCLNGFDGIDADLSGLTLDADADVGILIANNIVRGMARHGIIVALAAPRTGVTVSANRVDTTDLHGISLENVWRSVVAGNTIRRFNENVTPFFCAISLGASCHHNMIQGNVGFEARVTPRGIGFAEQAGGSYDYNTSMGNDFSGTSSSFPTAANANDIRLGNR